MLKKIERKLRLFHGQTVDTDPNPNERLTEYILSECEIQKPGIFYKLWTTPPSKNFKYKEYSSSSTASELGNIYLYYI